MPTGKRGSKAKAAAKKAVVRRVAKSATKVAGARQTRARSAAFRCRVCDGRLTPSTRAKRGALHATCEAGLRRSEDCLPLLSKEAPLAPYLNVPNFVNLGFSFEFGILITNLSIFRIW